MIKNQLQLLLNSNSNAFAELLNLFNKQFPEESGLSNLLQDYIYSETKDEYCESKIEKLLSNLLEGKV